MQFQLQSPALSAALQKLSAATESKAELQTYRSTKVDAYNDQLKLSAYGSIVQAEVRLGGVKVSEPFAFGVSQSVFSDLIGSLPETTLTVKREEAAVIVRTDRSRFKVNIFTDDAFPPYRDYDALPYVLIDFHEFLRGLDKVAYCANPKSERQYSKCIYVDKEYFVATDGFRLSMYPNRAWPLERPILLSAEVASRLKKLYGNLSKEGGALLEEGSVTLSNSGVFATVRLVAGGYPAFRSVLPKGDSVLCGVNRRELIASLKRVLILLNEKGIKGITMRVEPGQLILTSDRSELGESGDTVPADVGPMPEFQVAFNGEFMLEALNNIDGESVLLEFRTPQSGIVVRDTGVHYNVVQPIKR